MAKRRVEKTSVFAKPSTYTENAPYRGYVAQAPTGPVGTIYRKMEGADTCIKIEMVGASLDAFALRLVMARKNKNMAAAVAKVLASAVRCGHTAGDVAQRVIDNHWKTEVVIDPIITSEYVMEGFASEFV